MILGIVATHVFDMITCKTVVHLGWVIYGITYFGVIALVFLFFSLGSLSYVYCAYYEQMITVQSTFQSFSSPGLTNSDNQFPKVFEKLDTCFYGDGNILTKFNIASEMQTVTDLFTNIETY